MRKFLLLLISSLSVLAANAQPRNDSLEYRIRPDTAKDGQLALSVHSFNYLRNYEFFNDFQDGYTLYGTLLEPRLVYYAHPRLALSAGVSLRKDFGREGIYKTIPVFSIAYRHNNLTLINGALEGNIHHRFVEPIYDFERRITRPVEYGTQVVIEKKNLFLDAFINWDNMIYKPSAEQESFFAGASADIRLKSSDRLQVSLPLQVLLYHQGGQIDTLDDPLTTLINGAVGVKLSYHTQGFIQSLKTENYVLGYNDNSPTKQRAFNRGMAVFLNAGVSSRYGELGLSYFHGNKFISSAGMPLYQSVSSKLGNEGYAESRRELLMLRYAWQKELLKGFYLDFRVEPFMDLRSSGSKSVELYHSFFLRYKQEFSILRRK